VTFFTHWLVFIFFCYLLHIFQDVEASRQLLVTLISLAEANHEIQFIMAFRPRNVEVTWIECGYTHKYIHLSSLEVHALQVLSNWRKMHTPQLFFDVEEVHVASSLVCEDVCQEQNPFTLASAMSNPEDIELLKAYGRNVALLVAQQE